MSKKGVLLLNIGSPRTYQVEDVKAYLKTFLMDKDIINIPFFVRWPLVHGIIVPRRAPFSAENYKKIWMENEGSPLTVYTNRFAKALQESLGSSYSVKVGMRYSDPLIGKALEEFAKEEISSLLIVPLYPQYAEATTGSSVKEVNRWLKKLGLDIPTSVLPPFYVDDSFIKPSVRLVKESTAGKNFDHYLFSFHGLPESQVRKVHGCLRTEDCCFDQDACAKNCYRAQCYATATKMAESLNLPDSHWSVSFQSRLGRAEWIKPATDHTLEVLAQKGKKSVAVVCPSFVADCIETLEEIGIGGQEIFEHNGGTDYQLVPCVNDDREWIEGFASLLRNQK